MITIPYSRSNGQFTLTDSLILDEETYAAMTQDEITAMQDARFEKWLAIITAPSSVDEVT